MTITNVNYVLKLSSPEINVTSLEFFSVVKVGGHPIPQRNLVLDRDQENSRYAGEFLNVTVSEDCDLIERISIVANGPINSYVELTAVFCDGKRILNEPLSVVERNGAITENFDNVNLVEL